jgi:PAS domain S-box-containing protein
VRRLAGKRSFGRGVLVGGVALAVLTLIKFAFAGSVGFPTPFLTYVGAVMIAAWFGGFRAALVITVAAGALTTSLFLFDQFEDPWTTLVPQLLLFGAECALIAMFTTSMERSSARSVVDVRQAVAQLHVAMRGVDEGIMVQDADGELVFANERAAALCGYSSPESFLRARPEEVRARMKFFDIEGKPVALGKLPGPRLLRGESPTETMLRLRDPDDADHWMILRADPVYGRGGKVEHVITLFRDVTEERRRERALQESRQWLFTALRSIGDAVIATDPDGKVIFLNPVAEMLTGWSSADAEGKPLVQVFRVIDEDTRKLAESPVERVIAEGTVVGLSSRSLLVRRDGTELAIDNSAAAIRGTDGELAGIVLVFRDVSASRRVAQAQEFLIQAAKELNSSLDYRATLATVARLAVPSIADWCAVDIIEDGEINRLAIAHVDPEVAWVEGAQRSHPSDSDASYVSVILRTGEPEMVTDITPERLRALALDPNHLEFIEKLDLHSYISVPLRRGPEVFGVITLAMAESRRVYDAVDLQLALALADRAAVAIENAELFAGVERARAEAVEANRVKDEFMAMLGHELRNPLAPILTALDLMRLQDTETFARERTIIERQVRHVVRLVDDLLDVSRIAGGRVELDRVRVDVREVIDKAIEMARPLIEQRRQHLETKISGDLQVDGDPVRLAQVVANLLNNAAKYTEDGGHIVVTAACEADEVVIAVRDDGIGIEPNELPGIFELFVQEPQALDRSQGGLGLGLTIVRGLVELHGGRVTATSAGHGQGSEFVVRLPNASGVPQPLYSPASEPHAVPTDGERILVVDDNQDALELLTLLLANLGYAPHPAGDAADALAVAGRVLPTIAIVDIGLPGIDGYELARRLREQAGDRELRLIALTGYGQPSDRERSRAAGFAAHLVKPVSLMELRKALIAPAA